MDANNTGITIDAETMQRMHEINEEIEKNEKSTAVSGGINLSVEAADAIKEASESQDSSLTDADQGIAESVRTIFSAVVVGGLSRSNVQIAGLKKMVYSECLPRFMERFSYNIFENEYALFYSILKKLRVKIFSLNQLSSLIEQNMTEIFESDRIHLEHYSMRQDGGMASKEEQLEAFKIDMKELMVELSNNVVTKEQFDSACTIYTEWYKDKLMSETAFAMGQIMTPDGYTAKGLYKRRRHLQGRKDAEKFYADNMAVIRSLEEEDAVRGVVLDEEYFQNDMREEAEGSDEEAILDFGIKEIDDISGKLRRTNMIQFVGPPKGGKTTASQYLTERALRKGLNVAVWPLEGTKKEWISVLTALSIRLDSEDKRMGATISKDKVQERIYRSEDERQQVVNAKYKLMTGWATNSRGKLSFIDGVAYVEDFIDVLENHYETMNPYDVLVIDSPVNMMSRTGRGKVERISDGYMLLKNYIANKMRRKALCIATAQLKQSVIDWLRANPNETLDVTAGAESAETIRSPDEIYGLFSTKMERKMGQMKIYSIASRHHINFEDFYIGCDMSCGYFYSNPALNE